MTYFGNSAFQWCAVCWTITNTMALWLRIFHVVGF